MKKTSTIVKEKTICEIETLINNTAYIKSVTGKTGLLNIKTNQIVGDMDNYYTVYDTNEKLYYQEKIIEERDEENNCNSKKTIRIYDALNEKTFVDGWEVVKCFSGYYDLIAVKSPIDGKLHLFDCYACRKSTNIFDMPLDDVKKFFGWHNYTYLVVTMNGEKGLYRYSRCNGGPNLILPIEFENIEKHCDIITYTKNNKKYFSYFDERFGKIYNKVSTGFDEITIEKENTDIVYCKKENKTYVYNTSSKKLLFSTDSDEIKFINSEWSMLDDYNEDLFFEVVKNGKHGVISSIINGKKVTGTLLALQYDEIEIGTKINYDRVLYLKKNGKIGLFIGSSYQYQLIEPKYDKIDYLWHDYFALYTNGLCDIGRVASYSSFKSSITKCEIAEIFGGCVLSYKKNGKYGLLDSVDRIVSPEYDNISEAVSSDEVVSRCYILEKNNKKGLVHINKIILPIEYDEVKFDGKYGIFNDITYFALRKSKKYELAKLYSNRGNIEFVNNHTFDNIDFFHKIMVLKDQTQVYIFDYNEKLLKSLPVNTSITEYERPSQGVNKDYFYCINDVYYYYKNGNFEEVHTESNNLYLTTYETGANLFEISSYNKDEYDSFCSAIDSQEDIEAEKSLIEISEKGFSKKKYPTLVLKRVIKK